MSANRSLRYLAPNLITALGMLFGLLSLVATYEHRFVDASWLIIWGVLIDRLDGLVARSLKATSAFGVQMDSFADAINFGVAPAFLVFVSIGSVHELGFDAGNGRILLFLACGVWPLATVFRLAKFNVVTEDASTEFFFGVPTTLAAGTLVMWYLVLNKYAPPGAPLGSPEAFADPKIFGGWTVPLMAWAYLPAAMLVGAVLMASNLPTPKLKPLRWRWLTIFVLTNVGFGYICGFARYLPDYMVLMPTSWMLVSLVWGQVSSHAKTLVPPPFIPPEPPQVLRAEEPSSDDAEELGRQNG
jgi:CDP-diacylglycerol--serine O-phosphatidyltransferase